MPFYRTLFAVISLAVCLVLPHSLLSQQMEEPEAGLVLPAVVSRRAPAFTSEARNAGASGTVVLEVEIDETGACHVLRTVSPLGFGLDESAVAAVSSWRYTPARRNGVPVKHVTLIHVNFRYRDRGDDGKHEELRTRFNIAIQQFRKGGDDRKKALPVLEDLAQKGYPPSLYFTGLLLLEGKEIAQDKEKGLSRIQQAADKKFGLALQEIGVRALHGNGVPQDQERAMEMLKLAAERGGTRAQQMLGVRYTGQFGVARDTGRAERYFRLCAAAADLICQYQLGRLFLSENDPGSRDYLEGIAWMRIAAARGLESAMTEAAKAAEPLNAEQLARVDKFVADLQPDEKKGQ